MPPLTLRPSSAPAVAAALGKLLQRWRASSLASRHLCSTSLVTPLSCLYCSIPMTWQVLAPAALAERRGPAVQHPVVKLLPQSGDALPRLATARLHGRQLHWHVRQRTRPAVAARASMTATAWAALHAAPLQVCIQAGEGPGQLRRGAAHPRGWPRAGHPLGDALQEVRASAVGWGGAGEACACCGRWRAV